MEDPEIAKLSQKLISLGCFTYLDEKYRPDALRLKIAEAKERLVDALLDEWKHRYDTRINSNYELVIDKKERKAVLAEIAKYSGLFKVGFKSATFIERVLERLITGSCSKPKLDITCLKEKDKICDILIENNEHLGDTTIKKRYIQDLNLLISDQRDWLLKKKPNRMSELEQQEGSEIFERFHAPIFDKDGDFLPDRLPLVHATRFKPQRDEQGLYQLDCLANATNFAYPRNTLHFTVGYIVESHLAGNWDDMPYIIITPMKGLMDHYTPAAIQSIDTYFEVGIGEKLILPPGTHLIEPAEDDGKKLPKNKFFVSTATRTLYQSKDFTDRDKIILRKDLTDSDEEEDTDEFWANLVRRRAVRDICKHLGYVYDGIGELVYAFSDTNSPGAEKIVNMARKRNILTTQRGTAHACNALNGCNVLGNEINDIAASVPVLYQISSGNFSYDPQKKEFLYSYGKKTLTIDYFHLKKWVTAFAMAKYGLDPYSKLLKAEKASGTLGTPRSEIINARSEKELAIYNKWKEVTQEKITKFMPMIEKMEKIFNETPDEGEAMDKINALFRKPQRLPTNQRD